MVTKRKMKLDYVKVAIADTKTKKLPLSKIVANTAQSRGMGVLSRLKDMGYGLFEKESVDKEAVWTLLFSDKPEDQAHIVSLIEEKEPEIVDLWEGLKESTQLQPVGVWEKGDNEFDVIYGMRRVLAIAYGFAKTGNEEQIECKVYVFAEEPTVIQLRLMALDENDNRMHESPIDRALTYQGFYKAGMTLEEIGRLCGKQSPQNIKLYLNLLDTKIKDKLMQIHTGKLGVDAANKLLARRKNGQPDNDRNTGNDRNAARCRLPGNKQLIKHYEATKKPKDMDAKEWKLWTTPEVRQWIALKLGLKYFPFSGEEDGNGKGATTKVLPITRKRAIQLLESLGKTTAGTWDDTLLKDKLEDIPNQIEEDGPRPAQDSLKKLLKKLTDGYKDGLKVRITED